MKKEEGVDRPVFQGEGQHLRHYYISNFHVLRSGVGPIVGFVCAAGDHLRVMITTRHVLERVMESSCSVTIAGACQHVCDEATGH